MDMERTRGWRRFQSLNHAGDRIAPPQKFKPEKNWKLLYTRGAKCTRARQLGFQYPVRTMRQLLLDES